MPPGPTPVPPFPPPPGAEQDLYPEVVPAAALPVWPPTTMGPLGVPNPAQPRSAAAVLAAPAGLIPRQPTDPEPPNGTVWPDNPRLVEPTPAADAAPAASWAMPVPAVPSPAGPPPVEFAPPISPQYADWARQQRAAGNVYGGAPPVPDAGQLPLGFESSGSLSGQILGAGEADGAPDESRRGSKAVIIIMVVMGVLVIGGLVGAIAYLSGAFH